MTTQTQTATYKGRAYRLLWIGETKFGRKAKLGFMDGSKEFWVKADEVVVGVAASTSGPRLCEACGMEAVRGRFKVCRSCHYDRQNGLDIYE